jgi:pimeloyl-ACP methyl ester carboxylesterase
VPFLALLTLLGFRPGRRRTADRTGAPDGSRVVTTADGVELHVEEDGDPQAPLTVVLVHGFTARLGEFDLQREALRRRGGVRIVLLDLRGHGRSGSGKPRLARIDQLAQDLAGVLDAVVPTGPVVLLGHSMGGMTLMALARRRPDLFGRRVVGVFLLATSAGDLVSSGPLGAAIRLLQRLHLLNAYLLWFRLSAPVLERFRRTGTSVGRRFYRHYLFGRQDADPELVPLVQAMLEETPLTVTTAFYPTFITHDETAALPVLRAVPVTILVGSDDRLTPASHSRAMAAAIGATARLIVVPGAGHSVNITRHEIVDQALLDLVDLVSQPAVAAG